jgi:hypothetical protein
MGRFRGPDLENPPARESTDPYRLAEASSERRRKLEVVAMIASVFAIAIMTGVFYTLLTR